MSHRRPVARINRPLERAAPPRPRRRPEARLAIGLLGGSFNPAHAGHVAISLEAIKRLRLDRVCWLVAPQNPLKGPQEMADFEARVAAAGALARHPRLVVSGLEQKLGTRFTIDTVRWLQRHCRARFVWLIGADNLAQLPRWRSWRELVGRVPIAVFDREPYSHRALAGRVARAHAQARWPERAAAGLAHAAPPAWVFLRQRRHEASSTAIRRTGTTARRQVTEKEKAP